MKGRWIQMKLNHKYPAHLQTPLLTLYAFTSLGKRSNVPAKQFSACKCLLISTVWMIGCRILSINVISNLSMQIRKSLKRVNSNVIRKQKAWFDQPAQSKQLYFSNPAYSGLSNKLFKIVCQVQKHLENVSEEIHMHSLSLHKERQNSQNTLFAIIYSAH